MQRIVELLRIARPVTFQHPVEVGGCLVGFLAGEVQVGTLLSQLAKHLGLLHVPHGDGVRLPAVFAGLAFGHGHRVYRLVVADGVDPLVGPLEHRLPTFLQRRILVHFLFSRQRGQHDHFEGMHQLAVVFQPVGQFQELSLIVADGLLFAAERGSGFGFLDEGVVLAAFKLLH